MVRPLIMKTEKKITLDKKNCENLPNFVTFKELWQKSAFLKNCSSDI